VDVSEVEKTMEKKVKNKSIKWRWAVISGWHDFPVVCKTFRSAYNMAKFFIKEGTTARIYENRTGYSFKLELGKKKESFGFLKGK